MAGSFWKWLVDHIGQIGENPVRGLMHAAFTLYLGFWYTLTSRKQIGTQIFDEEWDLLVILDACRVDVLESVSSEYEFIETVESRWSVGSHSHEWLTQTFSEDYVEEIVETAYITGNGHTHQTFISKDYPPDETVPFCWPKWQTTDIKKFGQIDMLWETDHQDDLGVPPRAITQRTVEVAREGDHDRIIAHYMQPHIPYIAGALAEDRAPTKVESNGWKCLETGEAEHDEVWELYQENLRLVLDEVELLLSNVDAENVVVTADHGNAFGEYSVYGHPEGMLIPCVKKVPWMEVSASDKKTLVRNNELGETQNNKTDVKDHLEDLGYL
jgi:hypothetical protein